MIGWYNDCCITVYVKQRGTASKFCALALQHWFKVPQLYSGTMIQKCQQSILNQAVTYK